MLETDLSSRPERHPVVSLLLLLIIVGLGFVVVGPLIGFLIALPFYPGSMMDLVESFQHPMTDPALKVPLYIMQGFATFVGLIAGPALFLKLEQKSLVAYFRNQKFDATPFAITALIVIVFMAVNSLFAQWNSTVQFPEFAKGFETWAREHEDAAAELTKFLTTFDSPTQVILAMFVIAVIPALGEEIVFRGIIQNQLRSATGNIHVSIWFAAFLFSAIHLQFFGFVPRLLLGALFGYLYYWSGNLWISIFAHFVNNGFAVIAMYFYQRGSFDFDVESADAVPPQVVAVIALMTVGLLFYFYKYFQNQKTGAHL
jgi:membrane protease YdiL (CAAX protease family)